MSEQIMGKEAIQALLEFLPRLKNHQGEFGKTGTHKNDDGSFFIATAYDDIVSEFNHVLYRCGWVDSSCDWPGQQEMIMDDAATAKASIQDIRVMLTVFARKEKFCEGIQLDLLREGRVQAILERLQELTAQSTDR